MFTPKYRLKAIYGQIRSDIGEILRRFCEHKGVEIIEGHLMPDHAHMLLAIPPKYSVSSVMGYLKGKSSLMIFDDPARVRARGVEGKDHGHANQLGEKGLGALVSEQERVVSAIAAVARPKG